VAQTFSRRHLLLSGLAGLGLAGCSPPRSWDLLRQNFTAKVPDPDRYPLDAAQIHALPYATLGVQVGDTARAVLVLATISGTRLTWMSADRIRFVTDHGRLEATDGLKRDLVATHWLTADPLADPSTLASGQAQGRRTVELREHGEVSSGIEVRSRFEAAGEQTLKILDRSHDTRHFVEHVDVPSWRWSWRNHFWLAADSGRVLASRQQYCPEVPPIHFQVLKPAAVS
jgi:Protein of unknown function (DUF2886).